MDSEIVNILVSESPVILPYSGFWPNAFTVVWGCVFLGIWLVVTRFFGKSGSEPSKGPLIGFSLLVGLVIWGVACLILLPENMVSRPPLVGTLTTFLIFAAFIFLAFRKKNCSLSAKLFLVISPVAMSLLAGWYAPVSAYLLSLSWPVLQHMLFLYFLFFITCYFGCFAVAIAVLKQETKRLKDETKSMESELQQSEKELQELKEQLHETLEPQTQQMRERTEQISGETLRIQEETGWLEGQNRELRKQNRMLEEKIQQLEAGSEVS